MKGKVLRQSFSVCLLAAGVLAVLLGGVWALEARAQVEGPICPPGFEWQRMSGVGCVQVDCAEMGGRLSYTSACICSEGLKPCSEQVDYDNFDAASCGVNCPGSRLLACVAQDALCPGDVAPTEPVPELLATEEPMDFETPLFGGPETFARAEEFIIGGDARPPTPGRAAAAALTGTVMLGFWSLVQGMGEQTSSVIKSGTSGIRQPSVTNEADAPENPDLRGTAGGLVKDVAGVISKWPKGGKEDEDATIRRPADPDPGGEVFYGEDARLILIGMGKLPSNTAQSEILLLGAGGFAAFTGQHSSGEAQRIRLASGREILAAEVVSVGFEGVSGDEVGSVEIDFSRKLTLVARMAEDIFDPPTVRAPEADDSEAPTMMRRNLDEDQDEGDGEVQL